MTFDTTWETSEDRDATWRAALSRDEIRELLEMRDLRSAWTLAVNWGLVFASFALVAVWPNPLSILIALFVIGARQLGLAVIMHDASHRSFFRSRALNDFAGSWLAATSLSLLSSPTKIMPVVCRPGDSSSVTDPLIATDIIRRLSSESMPTGVLATARARRRCASRFRRAEV